MTAETRTCKTIGCQRGATPSSLYCATCLTVLWKTGRTPDEIAQPVTSPFVGRALRGELSGKSFR